MKKLIGWAIVLAIVGLGGWYGYGYVRKLSDRKQTIATATVRQGDVVIRAFTRGELRAIRYESLETPNLGGTVQVTRMAPLGSLAREKDLIVEFDDSEVLSRIEESKLGLESTDENIKKSEAELNIRNNQDQVTLLSYRYAVRRAELQVKQNELKGAIDAKKNLLSLDETKRRLEQYTSDIQSRKEQAEASLAMLRLGRNRSALELSRDQQRLRQTRLLASMSGLISIRQNSFGGSGRMGAVVPDIREGDQVQPGMPIADVLDLSEMEIVAKVGELDRANLAEGQGALIQLDALAGKVVHGKIKTLSSTASANVMRGDPAKKFDVVFSIEMTELLKAVGATPEQIREVAATAEKNRNRPPTRSMRTAALSTLFGGGEGSLDLGAMAAGLQALSMQQFGGQGQAGGGRPGRGGGGDFAQMGRGAAGGGGDTSQAGAARTRRGGDDQAAGGGRGGGAEAAGGGRGGGAEAAGGGRPGGGRGSDAEAGGRGGRGGGGGGGIGGFGGGPTDAELAGAKLPPPPEEEISLEVLLRPGLLADVEIIVEKLENKVYIPVQAVFSRAGKPVVYVQSVDQFVARPVTLLKQSESTMVIQEGLKAGEIIALSDPTVGQSKKKGPEKKSEGGGAGAMGPG
jgi:hypothetical protein